jgi:glutamate 5-kinase
MKDSLLRKEIISCVRRVVIKLGSSVITTENGLDHKTIRGIVEDICKYKKFGKEFIIVTSGAIAAGTRKLKLKPGAKSIPQKQAAASVGQSRLMAVYEQAFDKHDVRVGQMLLTRDDLMHRQRYLNARNTLTTLLSWGVVPIINENDTVMVEEIKFGDNDNLSALVSTLADADMLLTLTDMEGFMDCDPRVNQNACLISLIEDLTPEIINLAGDSTSGIGRGGMASKLAAAAKVRVSGIAMVIAKGKQPGIISDIMNAELCGTFITPAKERIPARKHWIRYNLQPEGELIVDEGAAGAITVNGKSLLPAGIKQIRGHFEDGAAVIVSDVTGKQLAIGLSNYSSDELKKIIGRQTAEIDWILGYRRNDEAIHADNLVNFTNDL